MVAQAGLGGWTGYPEAQNEFVDDMRAPGGKKKKKKKGAYDTLLGNVPSSPGPGGIYTPPGGGSTVTQPGLGGYGMGASTSGSSPGLSSGGTAPSASGAVGGVVNQSPIPGPLGGLYTQGQKLAATDPAYLYGQMLPGGSGSNAAIFYGQNFDPAALGAASGVGANMQTNQDYMAVGKAIFDQMSGAAGAGKFLNPQAMMTNLLSYASSMTEKNAESGQVGFGPLAALASMEPSQALSAFISLVRGAMTSTMPETVLQGYLLQIQRVGQQYIDRWGSQPIETEGNTGMNIIKYIAQTMGASGGLKGGGVGGMGLSL